MTMSQYQDVIGQLPILQTYNHVTFGFEMADATLREQVVEALQTAVGKVTAGFPWLAGAVVNQGSEPGNSGLFKGVPWPSSATSANDIVRVKDVSSQMPPMAELMQAGTPTSMLDGKLLTPYPGFPVRHQGSAEQPAPVVAIQANWVNGGVLLSFSAQHNMIDATGTIQFVKLVATALRGNDFAAAAVEQGNRDRGRVIPLIAPGHAVRDHSHLRRPDNFTLPIASPTAQPFGWASFRLHRPALATLKALAEQRDGSAPAVPFISSGDALSALYWKCLADVRARNGLPADTISKFLRAIDARRAMGISHEYMGHMVYHSATRMSLADLAAAPLSTIACALRASLNDVNNEHSVRSYATVLASEPDKTRLFYGGPYNPAADIGSSAMPPIDFVDSFGPLLGAPRFIRRPDLAPIPGCVYFLFPEGPYVPVLVCLKDADVEGLKTHPEWTKHAEFIG